MIEIAAIGKDNEELNVWYFETAPSEDEIWEMVDANCDYCLGIRIQAVSDEFYATQVLGG